MPFRHLRFSLLDPFAHRRPRHRPPTRERAVSESEAAALAPDALLARLTVGRDGLTERQAAARLAEYGPNTIALEAQRHPVRRFLELLTAPLSVLLMALAAVSWATGEHHGAGVILTIVAMSTLLAFVLEHRSNRAAQRLRAMVHTTAAVLRPGHDGGEPRRSHEPIARLAPGDIVLLSAGDVVPADVRVLHARDLFVNQSNLTGESLPVEKFAEPDGAGIAVADARDLAFLGTHVVTGSATAVVVATGPHTAFAGIARAVAAQAPPTAFDLGAARFVRLVLRAMLVLVPLVFVVNFATKGDPMQALLFAVAVAVGLAPEMLPMLITVNLAQGALAMARERAIVKRLDAIQSVGAMDILCTDKTGTLTQDRVIVERYVDAGGAESQRVLRYAYLNSYYQSGLHSLLDRAVLDHVEVHEHLAPDRRWTKLDEIPFDFERRRMSVVVRDEAGRAVLICKGAVEAVLPACSRVERDGAGVPFTPVGPEGDGVVAAMNAEGFRVLAVASRELADVGPVYSPADERELTLLGYVAFLDPPKESAREALHELAASGVAVKVLTGDHEAVTRTICRQVGLDPDPVVTGARVDALDDLALGETAETTRVFARVTPDQKRRVIQALRARGHVVGYLGDGINDGPALKAADVGIAVDSGADVAKDAADIVLLEKNLLVLHAGVLEGRRVFGNIVKYVRMGSSSNFGNMLSVIGASAFLPFLPMAPVQVLLNNLLYDASQTALATDRVDPEYVAAPRRWDIASIGRYALVFGPLSSVFDYATFAVLWWGFGAAAQPALFQTGWFVESLLSQTLVVHVIRTGRVPFLQSRPTLPLLLTTLGVAATGVWLPFSPFAAALGMTPLPPAFFAALAAILVGYLGLTQLAKSRVVRRFGLD